MICVNPTIEPRVSHAMLVDNREYELSGLTVINEKIFSHNNLPQVMLRFGWIHEIGN